MITQNIVIQQYSTFERNIALTDANSEPLAVSGYTANASMARNPDSNTSYEFTTTLTNGNLSLRMEANVTALLYPGIYQYDVLITNGVDVYRVAEGIAEVSPGITSNVG